MENKYKPYRLVPFSRLVLCKLYLAHLNDDSKSDFTVDDVVQSFSVPVSRNFVATALDFLRNRGHSQDALVTRYKGKDGNSYCFRFTYRAFSIIEEALRNKSSDIAYFYENGDEVLDEIAGIDSLFLTPQEAFEDDPWSPLAIDRDDPAYLEAVSDVEAALEAVRGDNGFAANYPAQREGIIATLEDGLKWLKERCPSKAQVFSLLVIPLQWLSTNFAKSVLGEIAKKAAQSLVDLLHSLF